LAMQRHTESTPLQEQGASALSYMMLDGGSEAVSAMVSAGGFKAVVTTMHRHYENPEVQRWCLAVMWASLEASGKEVLQILVDLGGVSAAVQSLQSFPDRHEVQHWGLAFLREMVGQCDDKAFEAVVESNAFAGTINALKKLFDDADVQERGLATLAMLASRSSLIDVDTRASGLDVAVTGMQLHVANLNVQRCGIHALASLVDGRKNAEDFDSRIVAAIVAAMSTHLEELDLQVSGQDVLWAMTHKEGDDVVRVALRGGSVQAVMAAARAHPESTELKQACLAWSRTMEAMASSLGYSPTEPAEHVPDEADEAAEATTTATESEEESDSDEKKEEDKLGIVENAICFDSSLEVEF